MSGAEHDPLPPDMPHAADQVPSELCWAHTKLPRKARLTFWQINEKVIPDVTLQSTSPETDILVRRQHLLRGLGSCAVGVDTQRAHSFFRRQGLRLTPYRFVEEGDSHPARYFCDIDDYAGAYMPSLDMALVRRLVKLEAVNGIAFTESVLVHELAHGTGGHHHLVYRRSPTEARFTKQHGRGGYSVYDSRGNERGRFLEEAYAERMRGQYVEHELKQPRGFAHHDIQTDYFTEEGARADLRYTIRRTNGSTYMLFESFAAQTLDHLCQLDPDLETDLHVARTSAEGLRNIAKRIDAIKPGLYTYLRDTPYNRKDYRQRLIYIQRWLWHKQRHPAFRVY